LGAIMGLGHWDKEWGISIAAATAGDDSDRARSGLCIAHGAAE
jgi:hypothetical protein